MYFNPQKLANFGEVLDQTSGRPDFEQCLKSDSVAGVSLCGCMKSASECLGTVYIYTALLGRTLNHSVTVHLFLGLLPTRDWYV